MANEIQEQRRPVDVMKKYTNNLSIKNMFENSLGANAGAFLSSIIDLYGDKESKLSECDPGEVVMEALKAATLQLPINKNLGFAYIIPYAKNKRVGDDWVKEVHPQFQLGYKGLIQLAQRSGQYETINANVIYKGMSVKEDYLSGEITISGVPESDEAIGYFCYFKLINGFKKVLYMSKEDVVAHAKQFSQSYEVYDKKAKQKVISESSPWSKHFDAMALKTVTKRLLSKYGILSVEMRGAMAQEVDDEVNAEIKQNANIQMLDVKAEEYENIPDDVDLKTGEIIEKEKSAHEPEEAPFL